MYPTATTDTQTIYLRLIALWALCEVGLGGIIHLFRMPMSGVLLSGFAVITISLMAWYGRLSTGDLVRAWAIVMAIKFAFSPQSPPTAYVAVTFQAFFCLLCFHWIRNFRVACVIAAVFCLVESAFQRVFVTAVLVGFDVMKGKASFATKTLADQIALKVVQNSPLLIGVYIALHIIAGIWIGWLAGRMPTLIEQEKNWLNNLDTPPDLSIQENDKRTKKKKKNRDPYKFPAILAGIGDVLLLIGNPLGGTLLRAAVLWTFFMTDFVQKHLMGWVQNIVFRFSSRYQPDINATAQALPELRACVRVAWELAKKEKKGRWDRIHKFVPLVFALALR